MSSHDLTASSGTDHDSDCWFGVENARERKQIQDRLAQRARRRSIPDLPPRKRFRPLNEKDSPFASCADGVSEIGKRLAEAKKQEIPISAKSRIEHALQDGALVHLTRQTQTPCSTTSRSSESDPASMLIPTPTSSAPTIGCDTYLFPQPALSVYGALFDNGRLLGLSCSCATAYKSKPATPTIPESLRPTETQLSTLHFQWIDRFPFPRMRDNMIALCPVIDEEEFLSDLFHLTSFTLRHGSVSWDAEAWKIGPEFAAKWGYLFL